MRKNEKVAIKPQTEYHRLDTLRVASDASEPGVLAYLKFPLFLYIETK